MSSKSDFGEASAQTTEAFDSFHEMLYSLSFTEYQEEPFIDDILAHVLSYLLPQSITFNTGDPLYAVYRSVIAVSKQWNVLAHRCVPNRRIDVRAYTYVDMQIARANLLRLAKMLQVNSVNGLELTCASMPHDMRPFAEPQLLKLVTSHKSKITALMITGMYHSFNDNDPLAFEEFLAQCSALRSLVLADMELSNLVIASPTLQHLEIYLSGSETVRIACPQLQTLRLVNFRNGTLYLQQIDNLTALTCIQVPQSVVNDKVIGDIVSRAESLRVLRCCNLVSPEIVSKTLQVIDVSQCQLKSIRLQCPALHRLVLETNAKKVQSLKKFVNQLLEESKGIAVSYRYASESLFG